MDRALKVEISLICARLADSEEHAVESAVPLVAEDAIEVIQRLSGEIIKLEAEKQELVNQAKPSGKEIVVRVDPGYVPEDGDAFEAVRSALDHFEIPAQLVERGSTPAQQPKRKPRIDLGMDM